MAIVTVIPRPQADAEGRYEANPNGASIVGNPPPMTKEVNVLVDVLLEKKTIAGTTRYKKNLLLFQLMTSSTNSELQP
ncbi:hypothetical protein OsJ_06507 [Oryza sativa Japonica Group]|uniref:Uncharacterized protein n=2 Tax=Oryza TaxID=4527 RepID=A3A690_ORYSJ|nr:hypothetical protein OsJ_06507 [Oryza sativa Japonica Group]